jgi:hypothetical protein
VEGFETMRVSSFAIHEVVTNGDVQSDPTGNPPHVYWTPALVDSDPNMPVKAFTTDPVTIVTPNLLAPTSISLVMRLEYDEGEAEETHNVGVFLTNPSGEKTFSAYWIFNPGPTIDDSPELPEDRSFRLATHPFPFTFVTEGRFVLSLELWISGSHEESEGTYEKWMAEFVEVLANIPLVVIDGGN